MNAAAQLNASLSGRYAIDREIGRGGMAVVYLARDVRHNRLVALKVLNPELAALLGADRFLSEIRVTANLQHPHILPLFDSGQADGLLFYVMPYVAGESLRTRLERERVLPVGDAVRIASEVAAALESAHRQGVIHRDIKPENILLQDGAALVADFGIALAVSNAGGERLTQTGLSLGTPQYMSPEQATGERTLDARADIYSLGAVCYEMLAGEPPFSGPTLPAIVARVMTETPRPLTAQRRTVPAAMERAVLRALEKLPADRFASAAEFAQALSASDTARDRAEPSRGSGPHVPESRRRYAHGRWWAGTAATVAVVAWIWMATQSSSPAVARESLLDMDLSGVEQVPGPLSPGSAVLSPDGSVFAMLGLTPRGPRIHLRRLAELAWRVVPDENVVSAFGFSPDGSQLAFARGWPAGGELMVARADGSGASRLVPLPPEGQMRGRIAWTDRGLVAAGVAGLILYALDGTSRPLTSGARGFPHILPSWLRSRDAVVYSLSAGRVGMAGVGIARLTDTAGTVLTTEAVAALAGYDDHVVLVGPEGNLWTQSVSRDLKLVGNPLDLGVTAQIAFSVPFVASDGAGTLVFAPGEGEAARLELAILNRRGEELEKFAPDLAEARPRAGPRFSPDGRRIALEMASPGALSSDIWVYDRASKTALRLTTWPTQANWPSWTPDGRTIVYSALRDSSAPSQALFAVPADGSGSPRLLREAPEQQRDGEWTPDGQAYVMRRRAAQGSADEGDIVLLTFRDGVVNEHVLLGSPASELHPDVSPDGRFLAYTSNETGRNEVYVTLLPGPGPRIPVSHNGGRYPRWTRNGRELVYSVQQSLWAARMDLSGAAPRVIQRDSLMRVEGVALQRLSLGVPYDVTPDGEQFAVLSAPVARRLVVWQGWPNRRPAPP